MAVAISPQVFTTFGPEIRLEKTGPNPRSMPTLCPKISFHEFRVGQPLPVLPAPARQQDEVAASCVFQPLFVVCLDHLRYIHPTKGQQALVPRIELIVVPKDQLNQLVTGDQPKIALGLRKIRRL